MELKKYKEICDSLDWAKQHLLQAQIAPNKIIQSKHERLAFKYIQEAQTRYIETSNFSNPCCEIYL